MDCIRLKDIEYVKRSDVLLLGFLLGIKMDFRNLVARIKAYIASLFYHVGDRRNISLFCALAFACVLLHSVVPHSHHCLHDEDHFHYEHNCEQLKTFLQSSENYAFECAIISESLDVDLVDEGIILSLNNSSGFIPHKAESVPRPALRGPPQF